MTPLNGWANFYVIVGSSAGALIGLQFVVIALIADRTNMNINPQAGSTFATPGVIHFVVVLLLSAILSAPWSGITAPALVCGVIGFSGVVYTIVVAQRIRKQNVYKPVFEDWLFHMLFPFAAYLILFGSAFAADSHPQPALFFVGAAALLLLFSGIHNAWDAVTYHIYTKSKQKN